MILTQFCVHSISLTCPVGLALAKSTSPDQSSGSEPWFIPNDLIFASVINIDKRGFSQCRLYGQILQVFHNIEVNGESFCLLILSLNLAEEFVS